MEIKNIQSQELELTNWLLGIVNSQEEFELLLADKARLSFKFNINERRCSKW